MAPGSRQSSSISWPRRPEFGNKRRMLNAEKLPLKGHGALIEALSALVDPRRRRGVRHPVGYVVALALCAILTGCTSLVAIGEWAGRQPVRTLRRLGAKRDAAPEESTFRRVLSKMDTVAFEHVIGSWVRTLVSLAGEGIAIDGKSLRGARNAGGAMPHLVSAMIHRLGVVIAETRVADKTNEINSVEPLLNGVEIQGAVVTGDAMFAQKKIADYIVEEKQADYLFTVKENQPTLKAEIEALHLECSPPSGQDVRERTRAHRNERALGQQ